ncbi:MAG: hypothetical protein Q4G42_05955 [Neisseria sp.]|nr:hypothetical protein [Neisseria sp.]
MKKVAMVALSLVALSACAELDTLQGLMRQSQLQRQTAQCPPAKTDAKGYIVLEKGVTQKCQVQIATGNLPCANITDKTGADGYVCNDGDGSGNSTLFLFDKNATLIQWGRFE